MKPSFVRAVSGFQFPSLLVLASCLWLGIACQGALYLQLEGIEGDVVDRGREGWIAVESMQWGVENDSTAVGGAGGGTVGRTTLSALTISKRMDRSSAILFARSCAGAHIPQATLQVTRQGPEGEEQYFEVILEDVIISSYSVSTGASSDQLLAETFSLVFSKIRLKYSSGQEDVQSGWDLKSNLPT